MTSGRLWPSFRPQPWPQSTDSWAPGLQSLSGLQRSSLPCPDTDEIEFVYAYQRLVLASPSPIGSASEGCACTEQEDQAHAEVQGRGGKRDVGKKAFGEWQTGRQAEPLKQRVCKIPAAMRLSTGQRWSFLGMHPITFCCTQAGLSIHFVR